MRKERDHWETVMEALNKGKEVDDHVLASVSVLADRLERIKRAYPILADLGFSPEVQVLVDRCSHVQVS